MRRTQARVAKRWRAQGEGGGRFLLQLEVAELASAVGGVALDRPAVDHRSVRLQTLAARRREERAHRSLRSARPHRRERRAIVALHLVVGSCEDDLRLERMQHSQLLVDRSLHGRVGLVGPHLLKVSTRHAHSTSRARCGSRRHLELDDDGRVRVGSRLEDWHSASRPALDHLPYQGG